MAKTRIIIAFDILWSEEWQNKSLTAIKLYQNDVFVKDVDVNASAVDSLLSGTTYKLVAEYFDGESTESIYLEFTTLIAPPTV